MKWTTLILPVVAAIVLVSCAPPPGSGVAGPAVQWSVNPKATDPAIADDPSAPHVAYAPTTTARGRLVVFLHGTGSSPQAYTEVAKALQADGYHVIALRYRATVGTQAACPDSAASSDPDCHRAFRSEVVYGQGVADPDGGAYDHPAVTVSAANSVTNRLLKLVEYLRTLAPLSGWEQFQQRTGGDCDLEDPTYGACDLRWDHVAAMGHSQGAGVALYLAKHHPLDRVGMLSGTYEAFHLGGGSYQPAEWIAEGGLDVPAARIGALVHTADYGIGYFRAVQDTLGVAGPETSVTSSSPPYGGSGRLVTSASSTCPWESVPSHLSTAVDACTPNGLYDAAWRHLAGS